jgi:hypothetical protein
MEYISLGSDCAIAYHLERLGLRTHSYPFDWVLSPCIEPSIQDNFPWLDELQFKHNNYYPRIEEQWKDETELLQYVVDVKYKITFLHDFSSKEDLPGVKEKYRRRIDRFQAVMRDPTICKKCFRMGKVKIKDLCVLFRQAGYQNVHVYVHEHVKGVDWKKEKWNWKEWFESEPNEII